MHPHLLDLLKRGDPDELVALMDYIDESPRPLHHMLCWFEEHRPSVLSQYLDADRADKTPLDLPIFKSLSNYRHDEPIEDTLRFNR